MAPATRADEIELRRAQKAAHLEADAPNRIEHTLQVIEDNKIIERIFGGVSGVRARLGGLITGSGFAAGPEYLRRDLLHGALQFRTSAVGSLNKFYKMDMQLTAPNLADKHVSLDLYAVHRDYPHIDYYGPGPDSAKTGRSSFLLEDTSFQAKAVIKPVERLRFGPIGRYLLVNVAPGHDDRFVSADRIYTEQTTPGIQIQSNFLQGGGFVEYDWRDYPGEPRNGGAYSAQYLYFGDTQRDHFSFDRLDLEAQQYFGFFNDRRVIALRGRVQATDPRPGNVVPFYLQPNLGGPDDLRGFRPFRFYDNNAVILNGEYRWEVFSGLDMALFVDAGRVFHDWHQINLRELETDYGFGFRFNIRNDVFLRVDTGFSREGFQIWFKFNNIF
ncbi:MAG TPA: BamA/TamA family outer membrane protein [Bryobacteraceae bacterium]|jgi:hypothetical protein